MVYNRENDPLYDTTHYANEFIKLEEVIGQIFKTMNDSAQWGPGVDFHGHTIGTGNAKGTHQWWAHFIATQASKEKIFSDYDDDVLAVTDLLRYVILSAQRMNLYCGNQIVENGEDPEGTIKLCGFADGEFDPDGTSHTTKMIAWIIDPVEVLCKAMGEILNSIKAQVYFGNDEYNNWGQLLRGAKGNLLETITEKMHTTIKAEYARVLEIVQNRPWEHDFIRPIYFLGDEI